MRDQVLVLLLSLCSAVGAAGQSAPLQPPQIDVENYDLRIEITPERNFLQGEADITFTVIEDNAALSWDFNKNLSIISVRGTEGGEPYTLSAGGFASGQLKIEGDEPFRAGERRTLTFKWDGSLEKEQYAFLDVPFSGKAYIDSKGALLLSEGHWFPSHQLPTDVARATMRVTVPLGFTAVTAGELGPIETVGISEVFTWTTGSEVGQFPLIVAEFFRETVELDESDAEPVTFFVLADFESDLKPLAKEINAAVDFYADEYGPAPVQELVVVETADTELALKGSRGLLLIERSVLESASVPVFELARMVAQQWWGYSVRPMGQRDAWLQDGFATYAALRYLEDKHTPMYSMQLSKEAIQALKHQEKAPIIEGFLLDAGSVEYESIVASKGSWVLNMLAQMIGKQELRDTLRAFYQQKAGMSASIPEFVALVQARTPDNDLNWFFVQWIESVGIPEFTLDYKILKLKDGGFRVRGQLKQDIDLFKMPVDMVIETKGETEMKELTAVGRSTSFDFKTETLPTRVRIDPGGKILMDSDQMRVAVSIAIGDEYKEAGEYVSAISEYERAVGMDPRSSLGHFRLGEVFFEQHSYSNAANSFRDSLNGDLKPEWVETWIHIYLGKVYDILGQRQRAMAEYQKAINSRIDYNGAQAEAQKYLEQPYTTPSTLIGSQ